MYKREMDTISTVNYERKNLSICKKAVLKEVEFLLCKTALVKNSIILY